MNKLFFVFLLTLVTCLPSLADKVIVDLKDVSLHDAIYLISKADSSNTYVISDSTKNVVIVSVSLDSEPKDMIVQLANNYNHYVVKDRGVYYIRPRLGVR